MRIKRASTIVLSTLFSIALVPALASAQAPTGGKIAVIDVAYIFKNAASIKGEVAQIENQMKAYEQQMAGTRKTMQQEAETVESIIQGIFNHVNGGSEEEVQEGATSPQEDIQE